VPSLNERKRLRALLRRKEREKLGLLIAEGTRVVSDLLDAGHPVLHGLFVEDGLADPAIDDIVRRLRAGGVKCEAVPASELAEFADTVTPQGILVVAGIPRGNWEDLRDLRLLVMDGVQDPGNVGTLVRTAEALGAAGVLVLPGTVRRLKVCGHAPFRSGRPQPMAIHIAGGIPCQPTWRSPWAMRGPDFHTWFGVPRIARSQSNCPAPQTH
jgi:hypothetical protein